MALAFVLIWFLREGKAILFWLYFWQLKEYRIDRFLAHLQTAKGQRLLLNPLVGAKLILLVLVLFVPSAIFLLIPLYIVEIFFRKALKPVFTRKIQFLGITLLSLSFAFIVLESLVLLLIVDIATPFVVGMVVLALQPFTILVRNRKLAKAKAKRQTFKNLKVVGITGSYGKTSTKEFLAHILSSKYNVLKTSEHQNSEFGVANTIRYGLKKEHEIFVCEMGAYKKGEIKALAEVVQPHIGIVTGVNEQHLATFGSVENLLSAEGGEELADALPDGGRMFVNQNAKLKSQNYNSKVKIITPQIPKAKVEKSSISFEVDGVTFEVPAYGGHNVENLMGAINVARELGMTSEEIAKAAKAMPLELSPLKVKKGIGGATIIDSTYSANPNGVIADLEYLGLYEGKKVIIMPCLIELGSAAKDAHKRIGAKIAEVCDLAIITTKECFNDIKDGSTSSPQGGAGLPGQSKAEVVYMENSQEILEKIKEANAILLEGGKESKIQRRLASVLVEGAN